MLGLLRTRLVLKLGALMLTFVAVGFLASGWLSARAQRAAMEQQHMRAAALFAQGLSAGVKSSMLTGDPLATQALLANSREGLELMGLQRLRVFAVNGDEVFAPRPAPPDRDSLLPPLKQVLITREAQRTSDFAFMPVVHEERCARCHEPGLGLRGVIQIAARPQTPEATDAIMSTVVRAGFVQLMTARRSKFLDEYFAELCRGVPALANVTVYDAYGTLAFGDEHREKAPPPASTKDIVAVIAANAPRITRGPDVTTQVIPLMNEKRCWACHDKSEPMRGALVVATRTSTAPLDETLAAVSDLSVRHIMLSGLGRLMTGYLDAVAATGAVSTLRLYDGMGRLHHDAVTRSPPPPEVNDALLGRFATVGKPVVDNGHDAFLFVQALPNEQACQRCHGAEKELRGAIEVVIDTRRESEDNRRLTQQGAYFGVGTMVLVLLALYLALRTLVLVPMKILSDVAEHVGRGDLDVVAKVHSTDEVGRLADRLNQMVVGLRERVNLAKFVSKGAISAVASASGAMRRHGMRRHVVVLFSDIRGFTSFSETREPEEVLSMLNAYLQAQAEVVHAHGGDIDKFVGDELMALFYGEAAETDAAKCGVAMIEAVRKENLSRGVDGVAIGIGINAGPAIVGAMGAEARMDFTAIGDTVNLSARLCSNAAPGQVLVTRAIVAKVQEGAGAADLVFCPLEPILVKGKAQPIPIFAVSDTARRGKDS